VGELKRATAITIRAMQSLRLLIQACFSEMQGCNSDLSIGQYHSIYSALILCQTQYKTAVLMMCVSQNHQFFWPMLLFQNPRLHHRNTAILPACPAQITGQGKAHEIAILLQQFPPPRHYILNRISGPLGTQAEVTNPILHPLLPLLPSNWQ
jgi:hypothetical protein